MGKVVYIDPGHGGRDGGASLGSRVEKNDNLDMALEIQARLEENTTIKVVLARTEDVYVDLHTRAERAVALQVDAFLSLHRNAFNQQAFGTEVWVKRNPSSEELDWGDIIMGRLAAVGVSAHRGVKKGQFVVLENTHNIPALMIENLFIDNIKDNELYDKNYKAYAEAIGKGTAQFLKQPWGNEITPKEYIKIQGGAFSLHNEKGAREALDAIHAAGRDYNIPALQSFWLVRPEGPKRAKED